MRALPLLLFLVIIKLANGSIMFPGLGYPYPIYTVFPWRPPLNLTKIPIIDLLADTKLFDYCNCNNYTMASILPLLKKNKVQSNQDWIGVFDETKAVANCPFTKCRFNSNSSSEAFLNYGTQDQNLPYVLTSSFYSFVQYFIRPIGMKLFIDIAPKGDTLEELADTLLQRSYALADAKTGLLFDGNFLDFDIIRLSAKDDADFVSSLFTALSYSNLNVTYVFNDPNPFVIFYMLNHLPDYICIEILLEISCCSNTIFAIYILANFIQEKNKSQIKLFLVILLVIKNFCSCIFNIDVMGITGILSISFNFVWLIMQVTISGLVSIAAVTYILDLYLSMMASSKMKTRMSMFIKYPWLIFAIAAVCVSFFFCFIGLSLMSVLRFSLSDSAASAINTASGIIWIIVGCLIFLTPCAICLISKSLISYSNKVAASVNSKKDTLKSTSESSNEKKLSENPGIVKKSGSATQVEEGRMSVKATAISATVGDDKTASRTMTAAEKIMQKRMESQKKDTSEGSNFIAKISAHSRKIGMLMITSCVLYYMYLFIWMLGTSNPINVMLAQICLQMTDLFLLYVIKSPRIKEKN